MLFKEYNSLSLDDSGVVNDMVNSVDWDFGRWDRRDRWKFKEEFEVNVNDEVFLEGVVVFSEEILLKKILKKERKSESVYKC